MPTNIRIGLDSYGTQMQKNSNFDFNRKHLRDEERNDGRRSRTGGEKDAKQESFREVLARVNSKKS